MKSTIRTKRLIGKTAAMIFSMLILQSLFLSCQRSAKYNHEARSAFERGEDFYKKNAFSEAIAEYTRAIELDHKYADAFIGRGNARGWETDDFELSQKDYDNAAAIDPKYQDFAQGFRYYDEEEYM
jgi:tetratricopeptide (TPR) repeat protein